MIFWSRNMSSQFEFGVWNCGRLTANSQADFCWQSAPAGGQKRRFSSLREWMGNNTRVSQLGCCSADILSYVWGSRPGTYTSNVQNVCCKSLENAAIMAPYAIMRKFGKFIMNLVTWHHMHIATKLTVTTGLLIHRYMTYQSTWLTEESCVMGIWHHMHIWGCLYCQEV